MALNVHDTSVMANYTFSRTTTENINIPITIEVAIFGLDVELTNQILFD